MRLRKWQTDLYAEFEVAVTISQQVLKRLSITAQQIRRKRLRRYDRQRIEPCQLGKLIDTLSDQQTRSVNGFTCCR